jgi:subtilisin family serine protease
MRHMRRVRTIAGVLVAVTLLVTLLSGSAFAASADSRRKIVMLDEPLTPKVLDDLEDAGITVLYNLSLINALAVQLPLPPLPPLPDPALLLDTLGEVSDDVLTVIDPICPTGALPPGSEYRWGMEQSKAHAAHDDLGPNPSQPGVVTVAVLDTGTASHSELNRRVVRGYDAIVKTEGQPGDGHGHGTHMAGIILANRNGGGVVGVAGVGPEASKVVVAPVKVLNNDGTGYVSAVIDGLQWVFNNRNNRGIRLVNMSFGFSFRNQKDANPLMQAIQELFRAGIVMVASAGNACCEGGVCEAGGGDDCGPGANCSPSGTSMTAPAAYPEVTAVGALDSRGQIPAYSTYSGPGPDVLAPGGAPLPGAPDDGEVLSTNNVGYGRGHGTSQAAACVTGAIALAWSLKPDLSPQAVRNLVTRNAVLDVRDMINALPR